MEEKEELIDEIQNLMGRRLPPQIRHTLNILAHPRIIEYTRRYLNAMDTVKCENYQAPWSCIREAEARYENIKFGWLGGANGVGYSEWWCEPCRKKVMDG